MDELNATTRCQTLLESSLSIAYQNVQGLNSKLPDLKMNKNMNNKDVIMITETSLSDRINDETITWNSNKVCRNYRNSNEGRGGVAMYVEKHIKYEHKHD